MFALKNKQHKDSWRFKSKLLNTVWIQRKSQEKISNIFNYMKMKTQLIHICGTYKMLRKKINSIEYIYLKKKI